MKTVGIVVDDWKLPIFKKYLDEAGFEYTQHSGLTTNTSILKVKTEFISTLQPIIEAAQKECSEAKYT